ncbi:hypothetical protein ACRALDRAFT_208961 [Sodiomyces alcalophilus JCM 7366]|uniref:uncharacterized protein n=1 Tax=Sodiomyces alcalophilus JCM 7366 TaxID=591952 RepID=UPI0039B68126
MSLIPRICMQHRFLSCAHFGNSLVLSPAYHLVAFARNTVVSLPCPKRSQEPETPTSIVAPCLFNCSTVRLCGASSPQSHSKKNAKIASK